MLKIILIFLIFFNYSCSIFLHKLGNSSLKTAIGLFIGLKPEDSNFVLSEKIDSIQEGNSKTLKVHLAKRPDSDISVRIVSDHPSIELNDTDFVVLTFTKANYSIDQTIVLTALIDNNTTDEKANISISAEGYLTENFPVLNKDIEGNWIEITPTSIVNLKDFPTTITMNLTKKPWEDIIITINTSLRSGRTVHGPLTFTKSNYNIAQSAVVLTDSILYDTNLYLHEPNHYILLVASANSIKKEELLYFNDKLSLTNITYLDFQSSSDGTIMDTKNNILWTMCFYGESIVLTEYGVVCGEAPDYLSYKDAIVYCDNLNLAGKRWRLPTESEIAFFPQLIPASLFSQQETLADLAYAQGGVGEIPPEETPPEEVPPEEIFPEEMALRLPLPKRFFSKKMAKSDNIPNTFGFFWSSTIRNQNSDFVSVMNLYYDPSVDPEFVPIGAVLTIQNIDNASQFNCVSKP